MTDVSKSGPTEKTTNGENMNALTIKDIVLLKMFLEKGTRENIFLETEKPSVTMVHTKLTNLVNEVMEKQKEIEKMKK